MAKSTTSTTMTNAQLIEITDVSASRLQTLMSEHQADIIEAIHRLDGDDTFTVNYAIVFDQKKDQLHNRISYGIKRKDEISGPLQNANQPDLPGIAGDPDAPAGV